MPTETDKNAPYVENYPVLEEWLDRHRARQLWCAVVETPDGARSERIASAYAVNGATFMVVVEADQRGWNIYTESGSIQIVDILLDAEERLGLGPKIGNQ